MTTRKFPATKTGKMVTRKSKLEPRVALAHRDEGPCRRSGLLEEAARRKLERLALEAATPGGAGLVKDASPPPAGRRVGQGVG